MHRSKVKLPPDTRLDWRDPNMPVIVEVMDQWGRKKTVHMDPYERRYHASFAMTNGCEPHYSYDPTYNLRRRRE